MAMTLASADVHAQETRSFLMRTPVSEASTCESWSIAIEEQRKALRAEQSDQRECSSFAEAMPSPTLLARNHELFSLFVSFLFLHHCVVCSLCVPRPRI